MWRFDSYSGRLAAISDSGESITYGQLERFAETIGGLVPSRELIFCLCRNTLGSLVGYMAFLNNRIVPLLLDCSLDKRLLRQLSEAYRPDYFWIPQEMLRDFGDVSPVVSPPIVTAHDYALVKTRTTNTPLPHPAARPHDDLAILLTTSGSTGSPHLVRQSYENLVANAASIVSYLGITTDERPITTLPMSYTYGLSIIHSHLSVGATVLLTTQTLVQKGFWSFFKEQGGTSFGGVPYTYELLKRLRFARMDLPSLKTMTQAGGRLPPELHREFAEYAKTSGRRFFVMYGQTEATARMSYLPHERSLDKVGSIGVAVPGGEFSLIDGDGRVIKDPNTPGELVYRGRNVTLGYADSRDDLIKGNENRYVLKTGDIATRDEDGYYHIVGRKKRFIKLYGSRISLDEAERLIQSAFPDLDSACAGRDDHMAIFITDAAQATAVKQFIVEKTGINPAAFSVLHVEAIPKNGAGKTLYTQLVDVASAGCERSRDGL